MFRTIRLGLVIVGLAGMFAMTTATAQGPGGGRGDDKVFHHAVDQIQKVRDELQRAPAPDGRGTYNQSRNDRWSNDYLSHRSRAVEHLNMAIQELQQGFVNDRRDDKRDKKGKK